MPVKPFSQRPFLIIGGTTKAASTSLYSYLSGHPEVCASSLKETRFFMDRDYPIPQPKPFSDKLIGYDDFFSDCMNLKDKVFMEATPDYLYSKTAHKISGMLPKAKIIFIIRDPIERLISWFKYSKQRGMLSQSTTFQEYVNDQLKITDIKSVPPHLRALDQGKYYKYLKPFLMSMPDRILLVPFEMISGSPDMAMKKICSFASIDPDFYDGFDYVIKNKSNQSRFAFLEMLYAKLRRKLAYKFNDNKLIFYTLKILNKGVKQSLAWNQKKPDSIVIDDMLRRQLESYYKKDIVFWNAVIEKQNHNNSKTYI